MVYVISLLRDLVCLKRLKINENLSVCLVKRLKFGTTIGLLINRNMVLDVLKALYIDCYQSGIHRLKRKNKTAD